MTVAVMLPVGSPDGDGYGYGSGYWSVSGPGLWVGSGPWAGPGSGPGSWFSGSGCWTSGSWSESESGDGYGLGYETVGLRKPGLRS